MTSKHDYDIIIYCGGKCGGTTLSNTFHKNNFKVLHMHSLTCNGLFNCDLEKQKHKNTKKQKTKKTKKNKKTKNIYIIT